MPRRLPCIFLGISSQLQNAGLVLFQLWIRTAQKNKRKYIKELSASTIKSQCGNVQITWNIFEGGELPFHFKCPSALVVNGSLLYHYYFLNLPPENVITRCKKIFSHFFHNVVTCDIRCAVGVILFNLHTKLWLSSPVELFELEYVLT